MFEDFLKHFKAEIKKKTQRHERHLYRINSGSTNSPLDQIFQVLFVTETSKTTFIQRHLSRSTFRKRIEENCVEIGNL